jgi:hypothetical protein
MRRRRRPTSFPNLYGRIPQRPKPPPKPVVKKPPPGPVYQGTNLAAALRRSPAYGRIPQPARRPQPPARRPRAWSPYPGTANLPSVIRRPSPYGRTWPGRPSRAAIKAATKPIPGWKKQPVVKIGPPKPKVSTAATIPAHAKTPAVQSTHAASSSAVAKAQAQHARPQKIGVFPAGPAPRPRRTTAGGTTTTTTTSSSDSIANLINSILQPQYAAIDQAVAREQEVNRRNLAAYQGMTQSYLGAIRGLPANVQADYGAMIDQTQRMASTAAAGLAAASPNADVQSMLASIGAPESQRSQLATQAQNIYQGGGAVLGYLGGTIPGQTLARVGAAQTAYAHEIPSQIAARALQGTQSLEYNFGQNLQSLYDQRAQIAGQIPKLTLDIRAQQQAERDKQRALALEQWIFRKKFGLDVAKTRASIAQRGQQIAISRGNLGVSRANVQLRAIQNDRNWKATLARLGIAQAGLKLRAAQAQAKLQGGGFTTSQVIQLRKRAGKIANDAYNGVATKQNGVEGTVHQTYQHALSDMLAEGIPLTVAQKALNTYWSRPGMVAPFEVDPATGKRLSGAGRPWQSYQQRQARAKATKKK